MGCVHKMVSKLLAREHTINIETFFKDFLGCVEFTFHVDAYSKLCQE
jgi:hypothetical protein